MGPHTYNEISVFLPLRSPLAPRRARPSKTMLRQAFKAAAPQRAAGSRSIIKPSCPVQRRQAQISGAPRFAQRTIFIARSFDGNAAKSLQEAAALDELIDLMLTAKSQQEVSGAAVSPVPQRARAYCSARCLLLPLHPGNAIRRYTEPPRLHSSAHACSRSLAAAPRSLVRPQRAPRPSSPRQASSLSSLRRARHALITVFRQIAALVAQNIMAIDTKFWMRIATRNDSAASPSGERRGVGVGGRLPVARKVPPSSGVAAAAGGILVAAEGGSAWQAAVVGLWHASP